MLCPECSSPGLIHSDKHPRLIGCPACGAVQELIARKAPTVSLEKLANIRERQKCRRLVNQQEEER